MKPIVVLSCFDGMSGGQIALERAGIPVKKYYASEIDKYAIKVTQCHYPNTIQLGDINNWREWDIDVPDLIIAGSPCQGFSNAGHGLNFDDPRSKLFFVYKDILFYWIDKNPKLKFLLENVKMKKEWKDIITDHMGMEPVLINSALVSAQNRQRLYWANWDISQPEDKGIMLKDIVQENSEIERQFIYSKTHAGHPKELHQKAGCLTAGAHSGGNHSDMTLLKYPIQGAAIRNQITKRGVEEQLNIRKDEKSNAVVPSYPAKLNGCVQIGMVDGIKGKDQWRRVYSTDGKSPTLVVPGGGHHEPKIALDEYHYRKLTPVECERLQTVPDNWTSIVEKVHHFWYNCLEIGEPLCKTKHVKSKDVQELLPHTNMESCAFYIIKDIQDIKLPMKFFENIDNIINVNIAIEKWENVELEGCVLDTIKTGKGTKTLYIQTRKDQKSNPEDIWEELMVKTDTDKLWKISLEEVSPELREFIISILINLIMNLQIFTYVKTKGNILFSIENLNELQGNSSNLVLSNLRMDTINYPISSSQRYKMLGNGWTIDVIVHILRHAGF